MLLICLQKKERDLKRQEKKDKLLAVANSFQTRSLRNRRPVNYNYCKHLLGQSFQLHTQKAIINKIFYDYFYLAKSPKGLQMSAWWLLSACSVALNRQGWRLGWVVGAACWQLPAAAGACPHSPHPKEASAGWCSSQPSEHGVCPYLILTFSIDTSINIL